MISESPRTSPSKYGARPWSASAAESIIIKILDVFVAGLEIFLILVGNYHLGANPKKSPVSFNLSSCSLYVLNLSKLKPNSSA